MGERRMSSSSLSLTVNSFPSVHSFTSPRSWFLAFIVLLHLGFFWALSNGLSKQIFDPPHGSVFLPLPAEPVKPPPVRQIVDGPIDTPTSVVTIPKPPTEVVYEDNDNVIRGDVVDERRDPPPIGVTETRKIVVV